MVVKSKKITKMKNLKSIIALMLIAMMMSCSNQDWEFDDYDSQLAFFPHQTPARTLILGNYDQGLNENDNRHRFEIGVKMSGVYENLKDRKVHFEIDGSLLNSAGNVQALPASYYTLESISPITIPAGSTKGVIEVQLHDAFFDDPLSFGPSQTTNWVIPLLITDVEELDGILVGTSPMESPDRLNPADWDTQPMDYTLFGIKFMNKFHGRYLRRGVDQMSDGATSIDNIYHAEYVERDEVTTVLTSGNKKVIVENIVRRGDSPSPGSVVMELSFDDADNCTIGSAEGDPYSVSGTGKFVEGGDMWGGKARDVIYLDYTYTDEANSETHSVKDTLVVRDRMAVFERFAVELVD